MIKMQKGRKTKLQRPFYVYQTILRFYEPRLEFFGRKHGSRINKGKMRIRLREITKQTFGVEIDIFAKQPSYNFV